MRNAGGTRIAFALAAAVFAGAVVTACKKEGIPKGQEGSATSSPRPEAKDVGTTSPLQREASQDDAGAESETERKVVRVDVDSVSQLEEASAAHRELRRSGSPATLEVVLAAGTYDRVRLNLTDRSKEGGVAVILRGAEEGATILRRPRLHLRGPRIELRDLVFQEGGRSLALRVVVGQRARLERLAFVDYVVRDPSGKGDQTLTGVASVEPLTKNARAVVRDTWIARSRPGERTPLLSFAGFNGVFDEIRFERVGFAGVERGPGVNIRGPLEIASSIRLGGEESPDFVSSHGSSPEIEPAGWGKTPTPIGDDELEDTVGALLRGEHPEPPGGW